MPISWKDLFDTAGTATEAGSALLKDRVPARDAGVLRTATTSGLVCLGKTHMTELAFSGLGLNPVTASPPCVNDHDAVSGGSSSGAATSVAFGLAAGGIGSDTGGSVRVPAAWNDLVGLKTTPGRLSLEGVVPLCPRFDTVGPLCRSVEDAALLLSVLEGSRPAGSDRRVVAGRRLLVLDGIAMEDVEQAPAQAYDAALSRLEGAGAQLVARARSRRSRTRCPSARSCSRPRLTGSGKTRSRRTRTPCSPPSASDSGVARGLGRRTMWPPGEALDRLRADYLSATAGYDAVLLPTCPILPPDRARLETDPDYFVERNLKTLRNTRIGNLMGLPGVTLPTGVSSCGILLQTPPGTEERLLRLAAAARNRADLKATSDPQASKKPDRIWTDGPRIGLVCPKRGAMTPNLRQ